MTSCSEEKHLGLDRAGGEGRHAALTHWDSLHRLVTLLVISAALASSGVAAFGAEEDGATAFAPEVRITDTAGAGHDRGDASGSTTYAIYRAGRSWAEFELPLLDGDQPTVTVSDAGSGWRRVRLVWELTDGVAQDELAICFRLGFEPDFWWAPHLAPGDEDCIAQHVFRSPALIAARFPDTLVLVPDLDICGVQPANPWFLDLDARAGRFSIGMSRTSIPRHVGFARAYAAKLLALQDEAGFFPAWLHPDTLEPSGTLARSPETSMSVTFLLKLASVTGDPRYRVAALKAMEAVLAEIVPAGRWEDFETFWSCCGYGRYGRKELYGRKDARSGMHKQNNFSMFWTAESLLACYRATGDRRYLAWGRRTLDELSMTQQVWQPPFIYIPALGGFGVMNYDGEWNDSRQCLFAELFLDYYRETGEAQLFERGIAALKAAFVMMYCPENPAVKALWEKVHPFFGPEDYGFTMENYGHGGRTSPGGGGMGTFTIYDWGNGAAAEAWNRIRDHYGDVYIDRTRGRAFGIDSVQVQVVKGGYLLEDRAASPRTVRVVFEDGTAREVPLAGEAFVAAAKPAGARRPH